VGATVALTVRSPFDVPPAIASLLAAITINDAMSAPLAVNDGKVALDRLEVGPRFVCHDGGALGLAGSPPSDLIVPCVLSEPGSPPTFPAVDLNHDGDTDDNFLHVFLPQAP